MSDIEIHYFAVLITTFSINDFELKVTAIIEFYFYKSRRVGHWSFGRASNSIFKQLNMMLPKC